MLWWRFQERFEKPIERALLAIALTSILVLALIALFIFWAGAPVFLKVGPLDFIFGRTWAPHRAVFGILPMVLGSFWVTLGALLIGVPLGLAWAIFLAEFAPGP